MKYDAAVIGSGQGGKGEQRLETNVPGVWALRTLPQDNRTGARGTTRV